jgi:divalent metal cation (Fe/Co/Zn/Cd) transporter
MSINIKTPEDFHNKLGIVFHASLGLPLLPFVLLYLEIKNNGYIGFMPSGIITLSISYLVPLISGLLVLYGYRTARSVGTEARQELSLKDKLLHYYVGARKFYLLVGLACIILAVTLWLTASGVLIVSYVIVLFVMSLNRPTSKRYIKGLQLMGEEKDIILNKKDYKF